jgi:hypothetical protein
MRLDATTTEVVSFLRNNGFLVHFPIVASGTDDSMSVELKGGHEAVVKRDDAGLLCISLIARAPEIEHLSYYELLAVSDALQQQYERLHELWGNARIEERHQAREYADDLNRLAPLRAKVSRIIAAKRKAQYAAEAKELCDSV